MQFKLSSIDVLMQLRITFTLLFLPPHWWDYKYALPLVFVVLGIKSRNCPKTPNNNNN